MLTRLIPSTGEAIPVIGLGTWKSFDVGEDAETLTAREEILAAFVARGGKLVDSSPMYGRAEEVVGTLAARRGLRPELFVATKVWTSGKDAGLRQMEDSERKLRARPIDLMQVHNLLDVEAHLESLAAWKSEGRVRYVGVTHYTASAHEAVARVVASRPLDFVQINYSVAEPEAERRLLPLALDRGVAVIVNRPLASGGLMRRLQSKALPPWASKIDCTSWSQVLLKFAASHPAVTCVIPATSSLEHLLDNMKAGSGRFPDSAMRARIAEAGR